MDTANELVILIALQEYEGYNIEEAKLTYKSRENLPASAFCGPNRTYPAHDAAHVRAGLQRLSQFGGKMSSAAKASIFRCLSSRAKRMGVEISDDVKKKLRGGSVEESLNEDVILDWYLEKYYPEWKKNADV